MSAITDVWMDPETALPALRAADLLVTRDAEIARLRALVKEAYEEGQLYGFSDCDDTISGYVSWEKSDAKRKLDPP